METDCDHLGRYTNAKTLLTLTEVIRVSLEFDAFHDQIAEICRRYRIAELSVFGSVARGRIIPTVMSICSTCQSRTLQVPCGSYGNCAMNWLNCLAARSTWSNAAKLGR